MRNWRLLSIENAIEYFSRGREQHGFCCSSDNTRFLLFVDFTLSHHVTGRDLIEMKTAPFAADGRSKNVGNGEAVRKFCDRPA
jgi:hypothetical protein